MGKNKWGIKMRKSIEPFNDRTSFNFLLFQGSWVMFHNSHNNSALIQTLFSLMSEQNEIHSEFRLFISSEVTCIDLPTSLLHASVRLVVDVPKVCLTSRSFSPFDDKLLNFLC